VNATAASSQKTLASPTAAALALTILGPLRTVSESTLALHPMALAQDALVDALGQGVTTLTLGNLYKSKKPSYPTVPHGGRCFSSRYLIKKSRLGEVGGHEEVDLAPFQRRSAFCW